MNWRRFNGEPIHLKIKDQVRITIEEEVAKNNGGFMFIHNEKSTQHLHIKERMLLEVSKSIEVAYELCDLFIEYDIEMEVHADINTNAQFKSNDALKDAMGYIMGMGFAFKAKPEAFASSCCADKVIH
jgi:hypothetical protein